MTVVQPTSRQFFGINQQAYQALRAALSLNLRRQLLIAACDSVVLQERLATQLENDIGANSGTAFDGIDSDSLAPNPTKPGTNTILGRLMFEPDDAHLPRQVVRRINQIEQSGKPLSQLQVLGIEQMTRQPAIVQNHFLRSLNKIDTLLANLDTSLLVWVSWPWLRTIQESAPKFWQWRNGVYEFVGDPTPTPAHSNSRLNAEMNAETMNAETVNAEPTEPLRIINSQAVDLQAVDSQAAVNSPLANPNEESAQLTARLPRLHGEADDGEELEADTAMNFAMGSVAGSDTRLLADESDLVTLQQMAYEHFSVGYQYRSLIESGDCTLATIESAIAAYEAGLHCLESPGTKANGIEVNDAKELKIHNGKGELFSLGSCLNDLGTLYWFKAQQLSDPQQITDCLVHSIEIYSLALEQQEATMACQIYSNIGAVYSLLATYREPVFCLQQATAAYNQAITLSSQTQTPQERATLCNSLGSIYWKLSHHDQTDQNLHLAIGAYQEALQGYDLEDQTLDYAAVQNNLGIACWSLAKRDSSIAQYEAAIAAYQAALVYRTSENDPAACAVTYNNLALAYWDLSKEAAVELAQKMIYKRHAITAFDAALETAEGRNILSDADTAAIYHCLGDVYMQMLEGTTGDQTSDALQKALDSYIRSIECLPEESPLFRRRLDAIVANLRFHYRHSAHSGQQNALSQLPPRLMPYVIPAL